jgi:hypothetical protein
MALLPATMDFDPIYESFCENKLMFSGKQKAESIRLWAKYFAPIDNMEGFKITQVWRDLLTIILLNLGKFEWAKSFIGSKTWNYILQDRDSEAVVTFCIPTKCPIEKELIC